MMSKAAAELEVIKHDIAIGDARLACWVAEAAGFYIEKSDPHYLPAGSTLYYVRHRDSVIIGLWAQSEALAWLKAYKVVRGEITLNDLNGPSWLRPDAD